MAAAFAAARSNSQFASGRMTIPNARAAGAAAGGGGFLADAIAGVHFTEMIQVVARVGGGALVVVTVLAVHFQVGFDPTFNIRIGVGGVAAVAGHVPVRQSLDVGGHAIADL